MVLNTMIQSINKSMAVRWGSTLLFPFLDTSEKAKRWREHAEKPLDERRKRYKCGERYALLSSIDTWEQYHDANMYYYKSRVGKVPRGVLPYKRVHGWSSYLLGVEILRHSLFYKGWKREISFFSLYVSISASDVRRLSSEIYSLVYRKTSATNEQNTTESAYVACAYAYVASANQPLGYVSGGPKHFNRISVITVSHLWLEL